MSAVASSTISPPAARVACSHCALDVPNGLVAQGRDLQFCCHGCETAYSIIHSCGLDKYYAIRDRLDAQASAPVTASDRSYAEMDDPAFHAIHVIKHADNQLRTEFLLSGIHCGACVWLVERLPKLAEGVIEARLNMRRASVDLRWDSAKTSLSKIARTLDAIGYPPNPARGSVNRHRLIADDRRQLVSIGVAGACFGNVMLLAICLYAGLFSGMDPAHTRYFRWLSLGFSAISLAWPGRVFFTSAWAALKTRTPHLDVPITLALVVGAIWSVYCTIAGVGDVYFDSLSGLVFLLLTGRYVQRRQQRRASDAVAELFALTPSVARRVTGGGVADVPVEALVAGETVEVRPGETFPVDGVILSGETKADLSLMTGESHPIALHAGDRCVAGSINLTSTVRVRVEATGESTKVGRLLHLAEDASARKAPVVQQADRLSKYFNIGMPIAGLVGGIAWMFIDPAQAVERAVALLVVTCPCALGLATPLTFTIAAGRAARRGMMIKGGEAIELLTRPGVIYLDKTGTLTEGRPGVTAFTGDPSLRPLIAALEKHSNHPLAAAIAREFDDGRTHEVTDLRSTIGGGLEAKVGGRNLAVGSPAFLQSLGIPFDAAATDTARKIAENGDTPVAVAVNSTLAAWIALGDRIRSDAKATIDTFHARGWRVAILSGDHPSLVDRVARDLGISEARGGLSPTDKLDIVRQKQGGATIFVGDGVNDTAALAAADVGIAVGGGADASRSAASVYMTRADLSGVVELLDGCRRTMKTIRGNLRVSLVYNILAVAGSMGGMVSPLLAAFIMPLSSLTVLSIAMKSKTFSTDKIGGPR
ncbi:MAG: heavy metal translocating P-type ATPase [Phycisphaerae bacterium]|nr:heavy metal translocating P-type ATPase [Phycisphaerae bacterium]